MSIFTGKAGYNSFQSWAERSDVARLKSIGQYEYETGIQDGRDPITVWLRNKLAILPPNPDILEVGSGFGGWSVKLGGLYKSFTGAEVMAERVEHARKIRTGSNVVFHHIPRPDWNLNHKFPVVICITVIQHLPVPQAIDVLKGIDRHLADDGVALLSEGRIFDFTLADAEALYASKQTAAHMIPKPLYLLKEAVPNLTWEREGGLRFILRRKKSV